MHTTRQSVIVKGEDRILILRMVFQDSQEPFDLTNWSKVAVQFRKADRSTLEKTTDLFPAVFAFASFEGVIFTAASPGTNGNNISLVFDGNQTVQQVVDAWNTANPLNGVTHDGDGSEVLSATTVNLSNGRAEYRDVEVINEPLGKVSVRLTNTDTSELRTGPNQNIVVVVDKGDHPNGERRIVHFDAVLKVVNADL